MLPYLLTLRLDPASFRRLDEERRRYFPVERNLVPAHISLFHSLPSEALEEIDRTLASIAHQHSTFELRVTALRSLGRGVAYVVESEPLLVLRETLATRFRPWLSRQDAEPYRPHVTVQNKVDPAEARRTLDQLQSDFMPFAAAGCGLCLWEYRNGPWRLEKVYLFRSRDELTRPE